MKYNVAVALAYFQECGLPRPAVEYKFHPDRKWRFDFGFTRITNDGEVLAVACEVEGGVFSGGRHTRGAGFVKDMEKYNEAAALGWRIIRVQPKDLCTQDTISLLKRTLGL